MAENLTKKYSKQAKFEFNKINDYFLGGQSSEIIKKLLWLRNLNVERLT